MSVIRQSSTLLNLRLSTFLSLPDPRSGEFLGQLGPKQLGPLNHALEPSSPHRMTRRSGDQSYSSLTASLSLEEVASVSTSHRSFRLRLTVTLREASSTVIPHLLLRRFGRITICPRILLPPGRRRLRSGGRHRNYKMETSEEP